MIQGDRDVAEQGLRRFIHNTRGERRTYFNRPKRRKWLARKIEECDEALTDMLELKQEGGAA